MLKPIKTNANNNAHSGCRNFDDRRIIAELYEQLWPFIEFAVRLNRRIFRPVIVTYEIIGNAVQRLEKFKMTVNVVAAKKKTQMTNNHPSDHER